MVMIAGVAFDSPPQLWLTAWRMFQAPSMAATCRPPPPPVMPQAHAVGIALWQTGSTCQSLTEVAMLPGHHISVFFGMRGEHRCKGRSGLALLLPLARWGAGRTLSHSNSSWNKCPNPSFRCSSSLLWCRQSCQYGRGFFQPPRTYCPKERLSAVILHSCPCHHSKQKTKWDYLKSFQLGLNFCILQFKTESSGSVSDSLVWFLRGAN